MFSTEIRVNGNLVGYLYARRLQETEQTLPEGTRAFQYEYEYYEPASDTGVLKGRVVHVYEDGLAALVSIIFLQVSAAQIKEKKELEKKRKQA
jgi:hypothetical protein